MYLPLSAGCRRHACGGGAGGRRRVSDAAQAAAAGGLPAQPLLPATAATAAARTRRPASACCLWSPPHRLPACSACRAHLADELQHRHLQDVAPVGDGLDVVKQVADGALVRVVDEHGEGVALGGQVLLVLQELLDRLGRVLQQQLALGQLVDGVDGSHRVLAHVRVPVLQVGQDGGHQRLQDLLLADAAQEAQRDAADVLVGVLQVVAQVLADEDLQGAGAGSRLRSVSRLSRTRERAGPGRARRGRGPAACAAPPPPLPWRSRLRAHHLGQQLAGRVRLLDGLLRGPGAAPGVSRARAIACTFAGRRSRRGAPGTAAAASGWCGPRRAARSGRWR